MLDVRRPGWVDRIDVDKLDMGDPMFDVLGQEYRREAARPQLFGSDVDAEAAYFVGRADLFGTSSSTAAFYGFTVVTNYESFGPLTEQWRRIILWRKATRA